MFCESKREIERNEAKQLSESKHIDFKGSKGVSSVARCSINCLFPAFWLERLIVYLLVIFLCDMILVESQVILISLTCT